MTQYARTFIGVDPGLSGGIAIALADHTIVLAEAMPLAGNDLDLTTICKMIWEWIEDYDAVACIEKVSSMPHQGVASMFKFGFGTGSIHGILAAFNVPRHLVSPVEWQKFVLQGLNKGDKTIAISYVARVYPYVDMLPTTRSKKPSSGIADAVCIARYASYKL